MFCRQAEHKNDSVMEAWTQIPEESLGGPCRDRWDSTQKPQTEWQQEVVQVKL